MTATRLRTWKGLNRRHPTSVTAARIREHVTRYGVHAGEQRGLLARAADLLDQIAEQEPNR